jgi:spore coat protein U-like protein
VTCTNTTPFTIGLDSGLYASGAQRRMRGGATNSEYISYNLYSDAARTLAWTNSGGGLVSGAGTGAAVNYTVYGQVPTQATPSPAANYADTLTITVTY